MISVLHLLWIIPTSMMIGFIAYAVLSSNGDED